MSYCSNRNMERRQRQVHNIGSLGILQAKKSASISCYLVHAERILLYIIFKPSSFVYLLSQASTPGYLIHFAFYHNTLN